MVETASRYGRYILEERIALGGMAEIFRARTDTEGFQKQICIKRILPNYLEEPGFEAMFRDEAALAARLQHTNIVQVFDFGEVNGTLFLAMEFIDGADLNRLMELARECRKFPSVHQCCQIAFEMCRGLHYAHSLKIDGRAMGVVHRDVSPHNVLISRSGEIKIADFGIAKAAERLTHTATGLIKGKVAYMAPEQAGGEELDHRVDQFATGVVLWEMLTGERLFARARQAQTLKAVLDTEVLPPSHWRAGIPPELDEILLTALAQNPSDRFEHMRAMQQALGRFVHSLPPGVSDDDITSWVETLDALAPPKHTRDTAVLPPATSEFDETLERPMESGPGNTGSVTNPTITLNLAAAESQAKTLQANLVQATLQTKPKSPTRARPLVIALTLTLVTVSGVFIYVGAQSVPQKPSVAQTVTPKPPVSNPTPRLEKGPSQAPLKPTTPVAEPSLREKRPLRPQTPQPGPSRRSLSQRPRHKAASLSTLSGGGPKSGGKVKSWVRRPDWFNYRSAHTNSYSKTPKQGFKSSNV